MGGGAGVREELRVEHDTERMLQHPYQPWEVENLAQEQGQAQPLAGELGTCAVVTTARDTQVDLQNQAGMLSPVPPSPLELGKSAHPGQVQKDSELDCGSGSSGGMRVKACSIWQTCFAVIRLHEMQRTLRGPCVHSKGNAPWMAFRIRSPPLCPTSTLEQEFSSRAFQHRAPAGSGAGSMGGSNSQNRKGRKEKKRTLH